MHYLELSAVFCEVRKYFVLKYKRMFDRVCRQANRKKLQKNRQSAKG